jgi:hypothetical protein
MLEPSTQENSSGRNWLHSDREYPWGQSEQHGEFIDPFEELVAEALNLIGDISYGEELNTRQLRSLREFLKKQNFSPDDPLYAMVSWLGIFTCIFIQVPNATQRHLQSCMLRVNTELQGSLDLAMSQSRQQLQTEIDHLGDRIDDMNLGMKGFMEVFNTCMSRGGKTLAEILVAPKVLDEIEKMIIDLNEQQSATVVAREHELTAKLEHYQQKFLEQIAGLEQFKIDVLNTVHASVVEQVSKGLRVVNETSSPTSDLGLNRKIWAGALALLLLGTGGGYFFSKSETQLTVEQAAELTWAKSPEGSKMRRLLRLNPGINNGNCPRPGDKISVNGKKMPAGWCLIRVNPQSN